MALRALQGTAVPALLNPASPTVVLERLARSAGTTNWYVLSDIRQLEDLADRLSPRSAISFYFDGRVAAHDYDSTVTREILRIARSERDAVVGVMSADGMTLDVDFIGSQSELEDFMRNRPPESPVFYGAFPGRDNDGERAITVDMPDRDGVVRPHPH